MAAADSTLIRCNPVQSQSKLQARCNQGAIKVQSRCNHGAPFEALGRLPIDSDDLTAGMHLKVVSGRARRDAGDHSPPWHRANGPYMQPSHPRVTKHDFVTRARLEQG